MSSLRPIEIVGGGLAGLSLGLALRGENVPVVLHEAGRYPRHRVCGEFITGLGAGTVARLGLQPLLAAALRHREVEWFHGDRSVRTQRLPRPALGLSRHALDARLAAAFVAAGGDLRLQSRLADPAPQPGRVLATGRRRSRSPWLGLKLHAIGLPLRHSLELHLGENAYVGLSRVEGDRVNVCGLFRRRELAAKNGELLLAYLRACGLSALAARIDAAVRDPESFCAVAGVAFDPRVSSAAPAALGDACAMIPPFTGNGMAMAFQGAELAVEPLLGYARAELPWDVACARLQCDLRRNFRVRLASAGLLHPFLLQPSQQRWLSALTRSRLLPLRPLYTLLH
jgi:flavin-dependent dehydrogenase